MAFVETNTGAVKGTKAPEDFTFSSEEVDRHVICKSPDKLKRLLDEIEGGATVHFISDGDWSINDLVMILLKKYQPADLYFSTYALRETQARQLVLAQQEGILKSVNMLIDYRANARTPEVLQLAANNFNRVEFLQIHAKVTVIDSPIGSVSIAGSANWTNNPRIEYGCVSLNPELAAFHKSWFKAVFEKQKLFK